jgi:hypothetical protein
MSQGAMRVAPRWSVVMPPMQKCGDAFGQVTQELVSHWQQIGYIRLSLESQYA